MRWTLLFSARIGLPCGRPLEVEMFLGFSNQACLSSEAAIQLPEALYRALFVTPLNWRVLSGTEVREISQMLINPFWSPEITYFPSLLKPNAVPLSLIGIWMNSVPVRAFQTRMVLSSPVVTIQRLSSLNRTACTASLCDMIRSWVPVSAFQTLT